MREQLRVDTCKPLWSWMRECSASCIARLRSMTQGLIAYGGDARAHAAKKQDLMDVCLAGATGLIGSELLTLLLAQPRVANVWCLGRTPPPTENPKLRFVKTEFANLSPAEPIPAAVFFCSLGTTIRKAGSEENFRKVDYTYILEFAKLAEKSGARQLQVVSALGADKNSRIFYNRVKAETEAGLQTMRIPNIVVLRPSLLLGQRKESRIIESLFIRLAPVYPWLLSGRLKKYAPIPAAAVAKAMWENAAGKSSNIGFTVIENEALLEAARSSPSA